jgi:hypothetical protein
LARYCTAMALEDVEVIRRLFAAFDAEDWEGQ